MAAKLRPIHLGFLIALGFFLSPAQFLLAQHKVELQVILDTLNTELIITQNMVLVNNTDQTLDEFYFLDWANSFSDKSSPLGQRFAENFESSFHFEKDKNRGRTIIENWTIDGALANYNRPEIDQIHLRLPRTLMPGDSVTTRLNYRVKVPKDKFTRFGIDNKGNYHLKYWWIAPAAYDDAWVLYSNKNLDDFTMAPVRLEAEFIYPAHLRFKTDLDSIGANFNQTLTGSARTDIGNTDYSSSGKTSLKSSIFKNKKTQDLSSTLKVLHKGTRQDVVPIHWFHNPEEFQVYQTEHLKIITDFDLKKSNPEIRQFQLERIDEFLNEQIGPLKEETFMIDTRQYKLNPVYGLNQLPDFFNPFPAGFDQELAFMKLITDQYLKRTLAINLRDHYWIRAGLQIYLLQEYVQKYYPNQKLLGSLSRWPIVKWSRLSTLDFNAQYPLVYLNGARNNVHQTLSTPKDQLINFNAKISNDYLAGVHVVLLKQYLGADTLRQRIKKLWTKDFKAINPKEFERLLSNQQVDLSWYFNSFIRERTSNDFKISEVSARGDSLDVTVINKGKATSPVRITRFDNDTVSGNTWTPPFKEKITISIPSYQTQRLVVNATGEVPEINQRNNYAGVEKNYRRPVQLRLIQDVEDPNYRQIFMLPSVGYNLYDGLSLGIRWYNRTVLPKPLHYNFEPQYALRSNSLVGGGSVVYNHWNETSDLFLKRFGIAGNYFSYDEGLFYRRLSPYAIFAFRDQNDLRKNKRQYVTLRSVHVTRDKSPVATAQEPNYSVYNLQYNYSDNNLINFYSAAFNAQWSSAFTKISAQFEYRKLYLSNRQINLRFFTGLFLRNETPTNEDYFSFALDRPTDYLFDYNYYGRSESSGIYSQQLIIAEGGFKSKLQPSFADQWIATFNSSVNLWRWIYVYGDLGLVKNKGANAQVVYDSGVRTSFVTDFFELYFPLWSNLGFEPELDNYSSRIRFIATLDIETLSRLFTRKWY